MIKNLLNKKIILIGGVFLFLVLVLGFFKFQFFKPFKPENITLQDLKNIQEHPPKDYFKKLKSVIEKNKDPYIKERAIFTLSDIAIEKSEVKEIVDYLKEIAKKEGEKNLKSAALANLNLIRSYYPLEKQGSLEVSVVGKIKKGEKIIIVAKVSSKIDVEQASVGIKSLPKDLQLLSTPLHKISLKANQPQEVQFSLLIKEKGEHEISVMLKLQFDQIDSEEIVKEFILNAE